MNSDYSAFNIIVWGLFGGFVAVVAAAVGWFRKLYPVYPCASFPPTDDEEANMTAARHAE